MAKGADRGNEKEQKQLYTPNETPGSTEAADLIAGAWASLQSSGSPGRGRQGPGEAQ